jgi:hypothetical protein
MEISLNGVREMAFVFNFIWGRVDCSIMDNAVPFEEISFLVPAHSPETITDADANGDNDSQQSAAFLTSYRG